MGKVKEHFINEINDSYQQYSYEDYQYDMHIKQLDKEYYEKMVNNPSSAIIKLQERGCIRERDSRNMVK